MIYPLFLLVCIEHTKTLWKLQSPWWKENTSAGFTVSCFCSSRYTLSLQDDFIAAKWDVLQTCVFGAYDRCKQMCK